MSEQNRWLPRKPKTVMPTDVFHVLSVDEREAWQEVTP